jgi:hypothetical protein
MRLEIEIKRQKNDFCLGEILANRAILFASGRTEGGFALSIGKSDRGVAIGMLRTGDLIRGCGWMRISAIVPQAGQEMQTVPRHGNRREEEKYNPTGSFEDF